VFVTLVQNTGQNSGLILRLAYKLYLGQRKNLHNWYGLK
jgi:hypothetical protein